MTSPHAIHNPPILGPASGYANAVSCAPGRLVFLGGQTAHGADLVIRGETLAEQLDLCCANVVHALEAAGARPEHLVQLMMYVTDVDEYRRVRPELGPIWRRHLGRHYPAIALFGVAALFHPDAKVELVGTAVVPE